MAIIKQSDLMYLINDSTNHNYDNYELIVDILDLCSKISGEYENHKEKDANQSVCSEDRNETI
jgi:hypothetical protein